MNCSDEFFESFNMSVEAAYDAYFKIAEKDILKGLSTNEEELGRYLANEAERWSGTPLSGLGGLTPAEYVDTIESFDALTDMFKNGAVLCDDVLPGIFLNRLRSFGDLATHALIGICRDTSLLDGGETSFMVPLMAVQVLGAWKVREAVGVLLEMLEYNGDVCDLLYEKVGAALSSIGQPAVDAIVGDVESRQVDSPQNEYLLMALAEAGRGSGSETVYRCLKKAFLSMGNKSVGAYCLANYGDGRAVPALRGYLVKNRYDVSKDTFYDIKAAIEKLGGNADDLGNWDD